MQKRKVTFKPVSDLLSEETEEVVERPGRNAALADLELDQRVVVDVVQAHLVGYREPALQCNSNSWALQPHQPTRRCITDPLRSQATKPGSSFCVYFVSLWYTSFDRRMSA